MIRRTVAVVFALVLSGAVLVAGCSGGDDTADDVHQTTTTAPAGYANEANWLCRPNAVDDLCTTSDLTTAAWVPDGTVVPEPAPERVDNGVDCFYLYPTVEIGDSPANATDFTDLSLERDAVLAQAARFSAICDVWAPVYPQVNQVGRAAPNGADLDEVAYQGANEAFQYYLDNSDGRPFVLIGDDQGADLLTRIIQERIDNDPALRDRMVSAILVGTGRVFTPPGQPVGGTFQNIPLCGDRRQRGCVIAYNAYGLGSEPTADSPLYAFVPPGMSVACANPAGLDGSKGQFRGAYFPTVAADAVHWVPLGLPPTDAPYLKLGEYLRGVCTDGPGPLRYVQVDVITDPDDARSAPGLAGDRVGLGSGLHDHELQMAEGDLLFIVQSQIATLA